MATFETQENAKDEALQTHYFKASYDKYIKDKSFWEDLFSTVPEIAKIPYFRNF